MEVTDLELKQLKEAPWNANRMDAETMARLRESIRKYGMVINLVVRKIGSDTYEVLSGNQRLRLLTELNISPVPCVIVEVDDAHARLLAQALNHIRGEDDLGLRADLVKEILKTIPESEVVSLLPEASTGLMHFNAIGTQSMSDYLQSWQAAQAGKLKTIQFRLTRGQEETVEKALSNMLPQVSRYQGDSPNRRSTALYLLCKSFLERKAQND